ncbi:MAG: hypothetical protein AAF716_21210 [Cyanobacteria bacterium P01_D01_bin.1]
MKRRSLTTFTTACLLLFLAGTIDSAEASIHNTPVLIAADDADDFDENTLYTLCENYPHNSRCRDWEPVVTLEDRPGTKAQCRVAPIEAKLSIGCKINFADDNVIVYVERESVIQALCGIRPTLTVSIPRDQVFARFESKTMSNRLVSGYRAKTLVELGFQSLRTRILPTTPAFCRWRLLETSW